MQRVDGGLARERRTYVWADAIVRALIEFNEGEVDAGSGGQQPIQLSLIHI